MRQPCEAAQCLSHVLASTVEQAMNRKMASPLFSSSSSSLSSFDGASAIAEQLTHLNLLEECSVEITIGLPISKPCELYLVSKTSSLFTPQKTEESQPCSQSTIELVLRLSQLVDKAAGCFLSAKQYEIVPPLCHWLLPLLSAAGQHEQLAKIHSNIRDAHAFIGDLSVRFSLVFLCFTILLKTESTFILLIAVKRSCRTSHFILLKNKCKACQSVSFICNSCLKMRYCEYDWYRFRQRIFLGDYKPIECV